MARVPRRRRSMAKHRRSREERRRLSEGGGGSAPHPPPAAEEAIPEVVVQVEVQRLTAKEIEVAYQTVFHYAEEYENILVEQAFYECEIERLDIKSFVDDKLSKVKVKNKDPDSDNIKNIRTLTKKSMELQESADMVKIQLNETRLMKTELEAHFRSSLSLIDQHVAHEDDEDRLFLGCLAYVLMME